MLKGIDLSHYQANADLPSIIKNLGLSFVILKATEAETYQDPSFKAFWSTLGNSSVVRGAYAFARPDNNPADDASTFLNFVNPSLATDLLILDLESTTLSGPDTAAWACGWADAVKKLAPHYRPGLYCGGYMDVSAYSSLKNHFSYWWYPRYPSAYAGKAAWPSSFNPTLPSPNVWGKAPDFWQFSQSFPAPGGPFDANVFNGAVADLRALNGTYDPVKEIGMAGLQLVHTVGEKVARRFVIFADGTRWLIQDAFGKTADDIYNELKSIWDLPENGASGAVLSLFADRKIGDGPATDADIKTLSAKLDALTQSVAALKSGGTTQPTQGTTPSVTEIANAVASALATRLQS